MATRLGVALMTALLLLYLGFTVQYAVILLTAPQPLAQAIGAVLIVLPLIGAWVLVLELRFAVRSHRLVGRLGADGGLPADDLPRSPSGRIRDRAAADAAFARYRDAVEQNPADWRGWLRLGLAYDASGDRRRARRAVRTAIALEKASGSVSAPGPG